MRINRLKRLVLICVCVVVFFVAFNYIKDALSTPFKIEMVRKYTMSDSVEIRDIYVVRSEQLLSGSDASGFLIYDVDNGEKVNAGGRIASYYDNEDKVLGKAKIKQIDMELKKIDQVSSFAMILSSTPEVIDKQMSHKLKFFVSAVNDEDYGMASSISKDIQYLMSEKQLVIGNNVDFSAKIESMKKQKEEICNVKGRELSQIKAPCAGYFMKHIDGYENVLNYADIDSLTPDKLRCGINKNEALAQSSTLGKIVSDYNWYIVCNVPRDHVYKIKEYEEVGILLPTASTSQLNAQVVSIKEFEDDPDAIMVLKCNESNADILSIRRYDRTMITFRNYTGLCISKEAFCEKSIDKMVIDDETGEETIKSKVVKGVYLDKNNRAEFREIVPICCDSNFIVCDPCPEKEALFTGETIKLYDKVVLGDTNIYEGRVIS